jgi:hypothetical protein
MSKTIVAGSTALLGLLLAAGCAVAPPVGTTPARGEVGVLPADARALRYGASAPDVFNNPALHDKVRALFGSDWMAAADGGGRLQYGAVSYFPGTSSLRMLRVDGRDYIAIMGCVQVACENHRGLVLIRDDGNELWARLDEGGFSRYYGHGPAMTAGVVSPAFIDSAWRAVEYVERA